MIGFDVDGFSLQDPTQGIYVGSSDIYSMPSVVLDTRTLAEQDGAILLNKQLEGKYITLEGSMIKDTADELDGLIDRLKVQVNKTKVILTMDYGNEKRIYQVTLQSLKINRRRGLSICTYTLVLYSQYPYGAGEDYETLVDGTITSGSENFEMFINGNYPSSPVIKLTVGAVTDGTAGVISLTNASNYIGITVERDWQVGDVLDIDAFKKTVYVNDLIHDYNGRFPVFEAGTATLAYSDTFTARSIFINVATLVNYI